MTHLDLDRSLLCALKENLNKLQFLKDFSFPVHLDLDFGFGFGFGPKFYFVLSKKNLNKLRDFHFWSIWVWNLDLRSLLVCTLKEKSEQK